MNEWLVLAGIRSLLNTCENPYALRVGDPNQVCVSKRSLKFLASLVNLILASQRLSDECMGGQVRCVQTKPLIPSWGFASVPEPSGPVLHVPHHLWWRAPCKS